MKNRILICFIIGIVIIMSYSCDQKKSICVYEERNYADTSLYITFYLDGVYKKFYQMYPSLYSDADGFDENSKNGVYVIRNRYSFRFSKINDIKQLPGMELPIDITLSFFKWKQLPEVLTPKSFNIDVHEVFTQSLTATNSSGSGDIDKMKLMDGYSLTIDNSTSIDNVFMQFKYQPESIITFFSNTYLNITKVELICSNSYIIEGSFVTNLGKYSGGFSKFQSSNLTDGKFRILRRFEP